MIAETALSGTDLATAPSFSLGRVEVFPAACEVVAGERREHLQKRVMQVLVVLASPPQRVVSRDELIRACWNGRWVTDDAVARCILQLRRLARDLGGFQIDTRVGIGYRLTVEAPDKSDEPSPKHRLSLMGPFRLAASDGSRVVVSSRKGAALIAMLAMAKEGERSRAWLQDRLWGNRPRAQGNASLRRELASLRRILNSDSAPLLVCDRDRVRLDLSSLIVDAGELTSGGLPEEQFLEGLDLPGETGFEEWVHDQRSTLARTARPASPDLATSAAARGDLPPLPAEKPSIAVMPFVNLSGDSEQDYLAEGMVEDIVGALARFKSIFVVAAGSSLMLDGKMLSPQEAARRLGVRYLLDGSVRKVAGCIRVAVRLKDAANGAAVWTDRQEDTEGDIFGLQDRVAMRVAGAVETTVQDVDVSKAVARPTDNMGSYDLYLRSLMLFRTFTRESIVLSIDYLDRALTLDPLFGLALSHSAVCHRMVLEHGWTEDPEACRARGLDLVKRALNIDAGDPKVLAQCAAALSGLEDDLTIALTLIGRAQAMNPGSSFVWLVSGTLHLRAGEADTAADHLERAIRLDPISGMSRFYRMYLALARFQQKRLEDALTLLRTTELRIPVTHAVIAAIHGHMGRPRAAQGALAEFLSLDAGTPEEIASVWFTRASHRKLLLDGIAFAEKIPSGASAALEG